MDALITQARREELGSGPSGLFLDKSDSEAVSRHNEKVRKFNQLDLRRRIVDRANRAKNAMKMP